MTSKTIYDTRIKFKLNSRKYGLPYVSNCKHFGKGRGEGVGDVNYHALRKIDLRNSEVKERQKRARSWCHNSLFLMSPLLVSNDFDHHENFKGKSRITLLYPITPHAVNLGPIAHNA